MQYIGVVEIEKSFPLRRRKTYGQPIHQKSSRRKIKAHFKLSKTFF